VGRGGGGECGGGGVDGGTQLLYKVAVANESDLFLSVDRMEKNRISVPSMNFLRSEKAWDMGWAT